MSSTEGGQDNNGSYDGDQQGEGQATRGSSSAVQDEEAPSFKLREAWPQVEVGGEKGLVVCTFDAQLLTGGL